MKRENAVAIKEFLEQNGADEFMIEEMDNEITKADNRRANAAKRNEKKRAASDLVRDAIYSILDENPKSADDIVDELGDKEMTPSKVRPLIGKLIADNKATKELMKNSEGNKVTVYKRV